MISDKDISKDDIKKTVLDTTRAQRNYWIRQMQRERKKSGDQSLNLSEWIIRHLPVPPDNQRDDRGNR